MKYEKKTNIYILYIEYITNKSFSFNFFLDIICTIFLWEIKENARTIKFFITKINKL